MTFDDSLPILVEALRAELGPDRTAAGVVLRDASGRLSFFAGEPMVEADHLSRVLKERLGPYARADRVLAPPDAPGAERVLRDPDARDLSVGGTAIRYLDRRIVGADWLRVPESRQEQPPRFVFASLKGGVGRSTALSVVAMEQAQKGRNVLVVDLDIEAPGVGSMLLSIDRLPRLGAIDYLVERNLGPVGRDVVDACVGTSGLTSGQGLVEVVPVVGSRSSEHPGNYLAKLSRAMIEGIGDDGPMSVSDKLRGMLAELEARRRYDLVLIDARAGLAEVAAGPLLALGANVLLFGTAQRQTVEGLRFLLAHLALLPRDDWWAIRMVHAKVLTTEAQQRFKEDLWSLFSEYLYEEQAGLEGFNFPPDDPDAPHNPLPILFDAAFADWAPADRPPDLVEGYFTRTFSSVLKFVSETLVEERT